jgi:hypothetical protein
VSTGISTRPLRQSATLLQGSCRSLRQPVAAHLLPERQARHLFRHLNRPSRISSSWSATALPEVRLLDACATRAGRRGIRRRGYRHEFWRKVLDLVEAGRPIAEVLEISDQSI